MHSAQEPLSYCPVCTGRRLPYAFSLGNRRAVRCADCRHVFLNPPPRPSQEAPASRVRDPEAQHIFCQLARYHGPAAGRLLLAGRHDSPLHAAASAAGFEVTVSDDAAALDGSDFDLCLLDHRLNGLTDPVVYLQRLHGTIRPGGTLVLATPRLEPQAPVFAEGDLHHFDSRTLQTALFFAGFENVIIDPPRDPQESALVFSRTGPHRTQRVLSVVVPAFNEAATLSALMDSLLNHRLAELAIEIVLVESNSTDGTREIALRYADHPRVRVILEEKARGKGHAVRTGLAQATGDLILIQDADLEYDLDDYDALLEPLLAGREAFVLGSRHGGSVWKMRQFSGQSSLSAVLNLGHWFFTTLVNVLFGQHLKDPFTMFKVFRRDCLFGLRFECNRFDFDYELLIKLILKGYQPVELPVNYRSRSFKEGKKVSMVRDPLTWLRALARLRFIPIDPLGEAERTRTLLARLTGAVRCRTTKEGCPSV